MNSREFSHRWLPGLVSWMDPFNQRHPWSHNDHFHAWVIRRLPQRRHNALVAVLHHLDADCAWTEARRLLAPGGRLMVVGLARPESRLDWAWDVACLITNPLIGLVKHLGTVSSPPGDAPSYPTVDPSDTYADLRSTFARHLPGARLRRRVGFRFTACWIKPDQLIERLQSEKGRRSYSSRHHDLRCAHRRRIDAAARRHTVSARRSHR